jgi:hypothetical protein
MPVLANARYERFAQIVAKGKLTPTAAYREALGANARDSDVNSCRWMKKPPIAKRIAELKGKTADKCSMTRQEFVESLVAMYRSSPGEASLDNPLCDSLISRGVRHAVFPLKSTIAAQLSKLTGWHAPTKVEVEVGDKLSGLLDRVFGPDKEA